MGKLQYRVKSNTKVSNFNSMYNCRQADKLEKKQDGPKCGKNSGSAVKFGNKKM